MASEMIGRTTCPECTFTGAHVKQKKEEGKEKLPYRYCPECGAQYYTRSARQASDLLQKTRASQAAPPPAAVPAPAASPELPAAAAAADDERSAAPAKKPAGFFASLTEGL